MVIWAVEWVPRLSVPGTISGTGGSRKRAWATHPVSWRTAKVCGSYQIRVLGAKK